MAQYANCTFCPCRMTSNRTSLFHHYLHIVTKSDTPSHDGISCSVYKHVVPFVFSIRLVPWRHFMLSKLFWFKVSRYSGFSNYFGYYGTSFQVIKVILVILVNVKVLIILVKIKVLIIPEKIISYVQKYSNHSYSFVYLYACWYYFIMLVRAIVYISMSRFNAIFVSSIL